MKILLRSALILGIIVVVGTALFAGPRLGELMERLGGPGFADDPEEAARAVDPPGVTGPGADTQHPTIGSVMSSTDVEARIAKPEPTHVENATSPPKVAGEIADSPTASSDSAAGGLDGREELEPLLVPSPSGLPAAVVRPVASWDIAYAQGHQAQLEGDLAAATERYRQAAKLNPEHPAIHYDLGYVLQIQGDADAAMEEYQKAIELNPDHPHAYYNLGFLLQKEGDEQSAVANYEKAASINPDNPYIHYNLGLIQEHRKDLASAETLYRKVIALAGDRRPGIDAQSRLAAFRRVPCVSESH
jgi:predicted TPR repeat methyltransferase